MTKGIALLMLLIANMLEGEAAILHDPDAMVAVEYVYLNRLYYPTGYFGNDPEAIMDAFHGYNPGRVPADATVDLATRVYIEYLLGHADPTNGSLFVFSHQDLMSLCPQHYWNVAQGAQWKSIPRRINGTLYRLYAYREWPSAMPDAPICVRQGGPCVER